MTNITEILEEYKNHLFITKRSKNTADSYHSNVRQFLEYIQIDLSEIEEHHVLDYFQVKKYLNPSSLQIAKTSINDFLSFAEIDVRTDVRLPKNLRIMQVIPSERDFKKIIFYAGQKKGYEAIRNQTILSVMYHAGLRIDETRCLGMDDIDYENRNLFVVGKGMKRRVVPINETLFNILMIHKAYRSKLNGTKDLFVSTGKNNRLKQIAYGSFRHLIKICFKEAGYSNLHPYCLRHAFCTRLIRSGADLTLIASLMGHSDTKSLFYYYVPDGLDGREAVQVLNF